MKKTVLFFAIALLFWSGYSQESNEKSKTDITTTLRCCELGYNISNLDFDPTLQFLNNKHRNGFAFGVFAEYYGFSKTFTVSCQRYMYSAEGAKADELRCRLYSCSCIILNYKFGDERIHSRC